MCVSFLTILISLLNCIIIAHITVYILISILFLQKKNIKETEYCVLDILPVQYFLQADVADIRCIYLRHAALKKQYLSSREIKNRSSRTADCNNKLSCQCNA